MRKLTTLVFWKARALTAAHARAWAPPAHAAPSPQVVDGIYNPLHLLFVTTVNVVLAVLAYVLPVVETLPEAVLLAVTELGGLVLDLALVFIAAAKALLLKAVYVVVFLLDSLLAGVASLFANVDAFLKSLLDWLLAKDPLGVLLSLLLARPFTGPAHILLATTKVGIQWTMAAVEYACALIYAAPAALGVVLIPTLYVAHAVWRRARRVVVAEPPLAFTVEELEAKVAQLEPLRVPALPILEKQVENEIVGFVNAVGTLQPLRVPPLDVDSLAAQNTRDGVDRLSRAQSVDADVQRAESNTSYSVTSSTVVSMNTPADGYDGLAAVRAKMDSFERSVAALPPLADASRAKEARTEAEAAALALAAAEAALAEAEAAFYAIDGSIAATTTTVTTLSQGEEVAGMLRSTIDTAAAISDADTSTKATPLPPTSTPTPVKPSAAVTPEGTQRLRSQVGNGPQRSSVLKDVLIRGLAASLNVASAVEEGTQARKKKDGEDKPQQ